MMPSILRQKVESMVVSITEIRSLGVLQKDIAHLGLSTDLSLSRSDNIASGI